MLKRLAIRSQTLTWLRLVCISIPFSEGHVILSLTYTTVIAITMLQSRCKLNNGLRLVFLKLFCWSGTFLFMLKQYSKLFNYYMAMYGMSKTMVISGRVLQWDSAALLSEDFLQTSSERRNIFTVYIQSIPITNFELNWPLHYIIN